MKIAYLGSLISSDSDFPLIRVLQKKSSDSMIFYFPAEGKKQEGGVFNLKLFESDHIIPANKYEEFRRMGNYFDISNIYVINNYHRKLYDVRSWIIWVKFLLHVNKQGANVFHFVWPFRRQKLLLFLLRIKQVMTVHDPIPHSGQLSSFEEIIRSLNFKRASKLILLSETLKLDFVKQYRIPENKIILSRFGYYDWIDELYSNQNANIGSKRYILFCGQIQSHKGVDVLMEAMVKVHNDLPDLDCVIAGSGNFYFDVEKYSDLSYFIIKNYFVEMDEMINLIRGSLFVVCPYKDATQSGIVQLAFSSGIPLIVTNVGALPISVKNETTGLVVPPSNKDELAKAIVRLAGDEELQNKFRLNIDKIWKKESSWDNVADDYMRMYHSL